MTPQVPVRFAVEAFPPAGRQGRYAGYWPESGVGPENVDVAALVVAPGEVEDQVALPGEDSGAQRDV